MISSLPNNIFSRGKGSHLPITNNVVYIQRGRLCGSRFQKEKFILHHQPLNHTKTFLIHHLTWFLSRRLGVRMEFQSWSGKSSRSPHPPRVWRPKSSPRHDWRRISASGHRTSQIDSARGRNSGSSMCAVIAHLHLPERPHLCRTRIRREGRRNRRRRGRRLLGIATLGGSVAEG